MAWRCGFRAGVVQRGVGLALQCALHTTNRVVSLVSQLATAPHTVRELFKRERQQWQRIAAAGVGDETSYEVVFKPQSGYHGRLFNDLAYRIATRGRRG